MARHSLRCSAARKEAGLLTSLASQPASQPSDRADDGNESPAAHTVHCGARSNSRLLSTRIRTRSKRYRSHTHARTGDSTPRVHVRTCRCTCTCTGSHRTTQHVKFARVVRLRVLVTCNPLREERRERERVVRGEYIEEEERGKIHMCMYVYVYTYIYNIILIQATWRA